MQSRFAAMLSASGSPRVRPHVVGEALAFLETGIVSLRAAAAPLIARRENLPLADVRSMLELSMPLNEAFMLGELPLEFGAADPNRRGFDLNPGVPDLFWRYGTMIVRGAADGRGDLLTASGADAFSGAARVVVKASCQLALKHRRGARGPWISDVDVVGVAAGLERYAEARRRTIRTETALLGLVTALSFEPWGFTLKIKTGGTVRVQASARHEASLRRLGGCHVVARINAQISREGSITDARLIDLDEVRSTKDPLAYFRATAGRGGGMWSTPEAQEYLRELRSRPEDD